MLNLIHLELQKKLHKGYLRAFVIAGCVLGALLVGLLMLEPQDFVALPIEQIIVSLVGGVFLIIEGTMIAGMVVSEYEKKTIQLMYQYPISRRKLHGAKLMIIYGLTAISLMITLSALHFMLMSLQGAGVVLPEGLLIPPLSEKLLYYGIVALHYPVIGFIPLIVGLHRKNSRATIIASVVLLAIVGSGNGGTSLLSYAFVAGILTVVGFGLTLLAFRNINTEDVY